MFSFFSLLSIQTSTRLQLYLLMDFHFIFNFRHCFIHPKDKNFLVSNTKNRKVLRGWKGEWKLNYSSSYSIFFKIQQKYFYPIKTNLFHIFILNSKAQEKGIKRLHFFLIAKSHFVNDHNKINFSQSCMKSVTIISNKQSNKCKLFPFSQTHMLPLSATTHTMNFLVWEREKENIYS